MAKIVAREVYPGITVDPAIIHGKPAIAGTRVFASQVVGHLAAGETIEAECEAYDLTPEQVRAAVGYAASRLAEGRVRR